MNHAAEALSVSSEDRAILEAWINAHKTPQQLALRAQIVVYAAEGMANAAIAKQLNISRPTVLQWRQRFEADGVDALTRIKPGRGRKPEISRETIKSIIDETLNTTPHGETHWSCRSMAKRHGLSHTAIQNIWDAHGLAPHRVKTFKLSNDPNFIDKLTDVVGLYMNPPDKAAVICVDEKSQIQALDRTQPGLPMKQGRCGTMTHDYKRHGTTSLFAALNVLDGTVIGECYERHRHQEFLKFLRRLNREFPRGKALHLILDNYGTHNHPNVRAWLKKHPRFHLHFTPTSSSWLNLIERWFAELTNKAIRRGVFVSVDDLVDAIDAFVRSHNADPKPFVWTASVEQILTKVGKCKAILTTEH